MIRDQRPATRRSGRRVLLTVAMGLLLVDALSAWADRPIAEATGTAAAVRAALVALVGVLLLLKARALDRVDRERRRAIASLEATRDSLQVEEAGSARAEAELRLSEQRYRFLAETVPQIAWAAQPDGATDYFNRRWLDYTGLSLERSLGWGWQEVLHSDDHAPCLCLWLQAVERGEHYEIEYRLRGRDGAYRWHLGRAEPMLDEAGRVVRWFGTCTDIDDQKRVEAELRQARATLAERVHARTAELEATNATLLAEVAERKVAEHAARDASRAKGEFLANMSHEIRTPMNGILGMTELALASNLTRAQREALDVVASSAESLLTIIDDILDFTKIEAGKLALDPLPFSPRDAVTETLRSLSLRVHGKGLELACRIDPEVPEVVVGDAGRLRQVLVNLVGNAVKFTAAGEVVVRVDLAPSLNESGEPNGVGLRFTVADTGIGIPPEKRRAIFDPFEQADGSTTRRFGGTGLGLTISAELVALMGGSIAVADNPGGGSLFTFTARFGRSEAPEVPRAPAAPALAGLPVLVVDRNATNRQILGESLERWGCRPVLAADETEAQAALVASAHAGTPIAVTLIDLGVAGPAGPQESPNPLGGPSLGKRIVLAANGADLTPELAADGVLIKPVRPSELLDLLMTLCNADPTPGGAQTRARPDRAAPAWRATSGVGPDRPAGRLRILLAEDHPVNQLVAARLIEDLGHDLTIVGDGVQALAAIDSARFDLVLMDVQMPAMDGFEALAAIRAREAQATALAAEQGISPLPRLPVVALTAHAMAGDRERCLEAGFDGYLAKPIRAAGLAALFDGFRSGADPVVTTSSAGPSPAGFDREAALALMGGNSELFAEVAQVFLNEASGLLAQAHSALEPLDLGVLARVGHAMAGSASNLVAEPVIRAARRLEELAQPRAQTGSSDAKAAVVSLDQALGRLRLALASEAPAEPEAVGASCLVPLPNIPRWAGLSGATAHRP